ncbi:hypothetical protein [Bythopirellula goksoeyrii]|uniref:Uncharacterized protein n=1 Tax=Bythopirellula goksoeyrii TaxID=1400387 RepID=A0A5B9Q714_9BACT|nr:hypothetical protein [Bythopirellula goksoeyrii]QEG34808.1 hypothetical protein Pr1d_20930 [Bythopirellula goksoeyrii]
MNEAYGKDFRGLQLTSREQAAVDRFEKEKAERIPWQSDRSIPQKYWRQMSGWHTKVINEPDGQYLNEGTVGYWFVHPESTLNPLHRCHTQQAKSSKS